MTETTPASPQEIRYQVYWADEAPTLALEGCMKQDCRCEYRLLDSASLFLEEILANGIAAVKAGKMAEAQEWLVALFQTNRYSEHGWLWLSGAAEDDQDRLECMQEMLKINPGKHKAQRGLARFQTQDVGLPPAPSELDET